MGKVKGWMMEMEEDALHMDKGSWIEIHGEYYLPIWEEAQMQRLENDAEQLCTKHFGILGRRQNCNLRGQAAL